LPTSPLSIYGEGLGVRVQLNNCPDVKTKLIHFLKLPEFSLTPTKSTGNEFASFSPLHLWRWAGVRQNLQFNIFAQMKLRILLCFAALVIGANTTSAKTDSVAAPKSIEGVKKAFDSMDKVAAKVQNDLDAMSVKLKEAREKIDAAKAAKNRKPNYWLPIFGGAILGIILAVWLRRRKQKAS
jgi:LPXTG-motif cell wall-anchored protein